MYRLLWICCVTALIAPFTVDGSAQASGGRKLALLIGNSNYSRDVGYLKNPTKDVKLLADTFSGIGFDVRAFTDVDRATMLREINQFSRDLRDSGDNSVGVVYYSGHGVTRPDYNTNYLIPIDILKMQDKDIWWNAVAIESVISELRQTAPKASTFIIVDACRNQLVLNTKGDSKGFNRISDENGMFIASATSPNTSASDEGDDAGPYASALSSELKVGGQDHLTVFQHIKQRVFAATSGSQRPWESNGLLYPIVFNQTTSEIIKKQDAAGSPAVNNEASKVVAQSGPLTLLKGDKSSLCSDLKTLADLSTQGFLALRRGAPDGDTWRSASVIDGFPSCNIRITSNTYFGCMGQYTTDKAKLIRSMKTFIESANKCLGKDWHKNTLPSDFADTMFLDDSVNNRNLSFSVFKGISFSNEKNQVQNYYPAIRIYSRDFKEAAPTAQREAELHTKLAEIPAGYCDALQKIIKEAPNGFKSLTGRKLFDGTFGSQIQLNGWDSCTVNIDPNNKYHSCGLSELQNGENTDKFIEKFKTDVGNCLGEGWSSKRRTSSKGRPIYSFVSSDNPAEVEIRSSFSDASFQVKLDVNYSK